MKYLACFALLFVIFAYGEDIPDLDLVRINIHNIDQVKELDRLGVIINQVFKDHVIAEVAAYQYLILADRGYRPEVIQENITEIYRQNIMTESPFGRYLTYDQFRDSMIIISNNNRTICRLETLGTTAQGRLILAMKISDNATTDEQEPVVHFDGDTHGDERCGWAAAWEQIKYLVSRYPTDTLVQRLVNSREIYIAPMYNPDGYAALIRYNSRNVDLNRNWGWMWGNEVRCGSDFMSENETRAFVAHFWRHSFVSWVSYHGGTLYISEPWSYTIYLSPPEQSLLRHLSQGYNRFTGYPYGQGSIGMYPINGCSKDYNYGCAGEMGWSIEVCMIKNPPADSIDRIFAREGPAMRYLIHKAGQGIHGRLTDASTGQPIYGHIMVGGINWMSFSCPVNGDYHRFYLPGTYSVTARAPGYDPRTINNVVVPNNTRDSAVTCNITLTRNLTSPVYATRIIGSRYVTTSSNRTYPTLALGPHDSQAYQLDATKWIVLAMDFPIKNGSGNDMTVYRSTGSGSATVRISNNWAGPWSTVGTANSAATNFDINSTGLDSARYVRLEASSQFMLDAVEAVQRVEVEEGQPIATPVIQDFNVWPNVVKSGTKINFANPLRKKASVSIYNTTGRLVKEFTLPSGISSVRLSDFSSGVYFCKFAETDHASRLIILR